MQKEAEQTAIVFLFIYSLEDKCSKDSASCLADQEMYNM